MRFLLRSAAAAATPHAPLRTTDLRLFGNKAVARETERLGEATKIIDMIVLASDAASYITGVVLPVAGGDLG